MHNFYIMFDSGIYLSLAFILTHFNYIFSGPKVRDLANHLLIQKNISGCQVAVDQLFKQLLDSTIYFLQMILISQTHFTISYHDISSMYK